MFKWLNKHLIPNKKNHYRPDLLEKQNLRFVTGVLISIELLILVALNVNFIANNSYLAAVLPSVLTELTNEERTDAKLNTLTSNELLDKAATLKAEDMAKNGYFAHTSPDGKKPWYWLNEAGYAYEYAGENLAVDFSDSQNVTKAWMNSPTHRANIEKEVYTEIGTGIATGMYKGEETVFVAQFYASPAKEKPEPVVVSVVAPTLPDEKEETVTVDIAPLFVPDTATASIETDSAVLGTTTNITEENKQSQEGIRGFFNKIITSPATSGNTILIIVGSIIAIVLVLTIIIEIKTQHFDLITNALIVVFLIIGLYLLNVYLSDKTEITDTSFVEFKTETQ